MAFFVLFVALFLGISSATNQCNLPPSRWCSSRTIARACNVLKQCEHYLGIENSDAPKVNFTLYYESLCGGCRDFIKTQYYPAFKLIGSIMNVNLVPYGNANEIHLTDNQWQFICQHGEEECIGNMIETCAMHNYPNANDFFPFIHCIETSSSYPRLAAPSCAKQYGLDYTSIESCVNGALGNYLEHQMALKTNALNPRHQYVPWVTLNGVHTDEIQDQAEFNLVGLICKNYKGSPKPEACNEKRNTRRCPKRRNIFRKLNIIRELLEHNFIGRRPE